VGNSIVDPITSSLSMTRFSSVGGVGANSAVAAIIDFVNLRGALFRLLSLFVSKLSSFASAAAFIIASVNRPLGTLLPSFFAGES